MKVNSWIITRGTRQEAEESCTVLMHGFAAGLPDHAVLGFLYDMACQNTDERQGATVRGVVYYEDEDEQEDAA